MSSIFDKYLESLYEKKIVGEKKIKDLFNSVKNNSKELSIKGKIKFEVEKTKLELKKKYIKLGKHVSKQFFNEEMTDFIYDEKFSKINQEIENLKNYISKVENKKIKL